MAGLILRLKDDGHDKFALIGSHGRLLTALRCDAMDEDLEALRLMRKVLQSDVHNAVCRDSNSAL